MPALLVREDGRLKVEPYTSCSQLDVSSSFARNLEIAAAAAVVCCTISVSFRFFVMFYPKSTKIHLRTCMVIENNYIGGGYIPGSTLKRMDERGRVPSHPMGLDTSNFQV